ncbi:LLM class F420-dependent oxidoreductase [Dactylosporangium sp. AC04546]|uniref:LLM class F420-dependent oxidoreductase n=1 Tax=Dactylosporangium sp. AC04546 TaxID=2862460 RepID=UPI001EDF9268|nr:LLM class F420-dependent oxidoreductase [Dactylosporangium sp. AC04546]WVK86934.1 LLM class F420-dependent oxidoreductase [Dactylosporangium sp. AC04546]
MAWGLTVPLDGVPLAEHPKVYRELADAGYTDLWSVEANGADGLTPLALAAAVEPRLRLGTAIVSSFTRGPALLAQSAAAMAAAAPGRFVIGIGASSNVIVQGWNGIPFDKPYSRTRDVVRFLRAAFTGERVDERYESFAVNGFRLGLVPETAPKIVVAALRERMLRMGAREADGVILNWVSAQDVRRIAAIVHEENPAAEIVARIMVCPSTDAAAVRRVVRSLITGYLTVPVYRAYQTWLGHADALAAMWDAWDAGDRKGAVAAVPDEVVDAVCVHGPPEVCKAKIAEFVDSGVTTPVLALLPIGVDVGDAVLSLAP